MTDQADDLDYSEANVGSTQGQGVRKNISLKLKGKGRGRGRKSGRGRRGTSKKVLTGTDDDEDIEETTEISTNDEPTDKQFTDSNLDEVIFKLETPAFSPMDRTYSEPLHQNKKLRWDHKVHLIGEKVVDPMIHCCEKCTMPILNYGRILPCKHVCCFMCAKKAGKLCPKCNEAIAKVEQSPLGTVFMCTFGGTRHAPGTCGRTYMSQRDLQAHINHRHLKSSSSNSSTSTTTSVTSTSDSTSPTQPSLTSTASSNNLSMSRDPREQRGHLHVDVSQPVHISHQEHRENSDHSRNASIPIGSPAGQSRQYPHSPASYSNSIPVSSARPNLITVPIQDDGAPHSSALASQPHALQYATTATPPHPLPLQPQYQPHPYPPHPHVPASSVYSQAPPITTQTFSQPPPPVHHQPPIHVPNVPVYSTPPPPVHLATAPTYTPPRGPPHSIPPPQHYPPPSVSYDDNATYMQQWRPGTVPPPPNRAPLPPRPISAPPPNPNVGLLQPRGPSDPAYRQPFYQ